MDGVMIQIESILETCRAVVPNMNIVTKKSFYVNIIKYAIPIMIMERIPFGWSYLLYPIYFFLAANATCDTTILNLVASKYATQLGIKCDCEEKQIIRANLASPLYYFGHLSFLWLLYYIPFVGPLIYWPLYVTLYGWNIMEYFLIGVCTTHRYKYFNAIFIWCFGVGTCINFLTWATCQLVSFSNPFFYHAILNFYTTQVVMNAIFKPTLYLIGFNPFNLSRSATSNIIKAGTSWILEQVEANDIPIDWSWVKKIPYTLKDFCTRDVCKFVIEENYKSIKLGITTLLDFSQRTNVLKVVNYFGEMFPLVFSEKTTIGVKLLQRPGTTEFLLYLQGIMADVGTDATTKVLEEYHSTINEQYIRSRSPSLEWDVDGDYVILKHPI